MRQFGVLVPGWIARQWIRVTGTLPLRRTGPSSGVVGYAENYLRLGLPVVFVFFLGSGITNTLGRYRRHDPWSFGDWLINYQGGFVRRGLLGEIVYRLYEASGVGPGLQILAIQILLFAGMLVFSYLLLRKQRSLPYAPLIFVPFVFMYHSNGPGLRKEQLFLTLMAFAVWTLTSVSQARARIIVASVLALYPMVVLTHEMLVAFLPYVLAAYVLTGNRLDSRHGARVLSISVLSILCASIVLLYGRPAEGGTERIHESLAVAGYSVEEGAIDALDWSTTYATRSVIEEFVQRGNGKYALVCVLVSLGFVPIRRRCRLILRNRVCLWLIVAAFLLTVPIFMVGIDWGRFIRTHAVALFLLSLAVDESRLGEHSRGISWLRAVFLVFAFVSYISFWHIPLLGEGTVLRSRPHYVDYVQRVLEITGVSLADSGPSPESGGSERE